MGDDIGKNVPKFDHKLMIEGINAVRELTKFFANPGESQWDAVEYIAGF